MSEALVKKVQDMLKEESWTRAAIGAYTKNNLIELATIVESARNENCIDEIKQICDEQLANTKESIIALYISGMLALGKGALDNSDLVTLVDIFQKNHKEPLVVYICESILDSDKDNKFALRTLADIYRAENNDKVWEIYEKIVKLDFEEADIAKLLADHYAETGDNDTATDYYKKALLRFVTAKNVNSIKELWKKLVGIIPEEFDFFMLVQRKIAKTINADMSALLMQDLYAYYKDSKNWDVAIDLLKRILTIDPKDNWARREITECFQSKYASHSHVDDYIRSSNLSQSFRNVFEAINDFEKHIAFDVKHFVYHRTWKVGVIIKVQNDNLTIMFGAPVGKREMTLKMAVDSLQPLENDHIWVLKATAKDKNALAKKIKDEKAWALKTIIKSFGNSCDFKKIKAELVPSLLTAGEWTSWNSGAKKIVETDATFGVNPNNINEYMVRDHEITAEEKLSNEFKAQKQFFARIDILNKFVDADETDKESELFADMFNYFAGFLKAPSSANEQVVASYLLCQKIGAKYPSLALNLRFTFEKMYRDIENPREMYNLLKSSKGSSLREDYLENIKMLPDWVDQYIKLFPTVLDDRMLDTLINKGQAEKLQKLAVTCFEDYKNYREAVLYFFEKSQDAEWFQNADIPYTKQLIAILNIISQSYREIDNHVNTTDNRKIIRNACDLLFENNTLIDHMLSSDMDTLTHLYTLVDDIKDLDGSIKAQMRNKILEKYPDYKFHVTEEKSAAPKGMMVTKKKLDEKQAREKEITTVEIPKNAQEIADARDKGDLKENQDYKAAKEYQHQLNVELKKLQSGLARAVIFDPTTATTSLISFGTVVVLQNNDTGKEEKYTMLGPWESDPENNVLSYMSPLGNALLDHKNGETFEFKLNDKKYNYTVKSITLADI